LFDYAESRKTTKFIEHILKTDIKAVKNDVHPFIKNPAEMDIWSEEYFLQVVDLIKFK
jgi:hypothetical protein